MQLEELKKVFASTGRTVTECDVPGYYKVDGGKHRSVRSLEREAKGILKQQKKAARRVV